MKNKTLLLLALFALPFTVKAGGSELHGGDSVVCFQNVDQKQHVQKVLRQNKVASHLGRIRQDPFDDIDLNTITVETLDIWESKNSTTDSVKFIDSDNVDETVKERINLVNSKLSLMAQQMSKAFEGFYAPSRWFASSTGIVEIDDSRELINFNKFCIPVQIAVQTKTRVYYDMRLFSKMDMTNKVALVLHELLYSWLKRYSEDSFNVRKYVGLMMRQDFVSYPTDLFVQEFLVDYGSHFSWDPLGKVVCLAKAVVDDIEIHFEIETAGINPKTCDNFDGYFSSAKYSNSEELNNLSIELGVTVKQFVVKKRWNSKEPLNILRINLANGKKFHVTKTTTSFEIETNSTSLAVKDGVINRLPDHAKRVVILDQEINLRDSTDYSKLHYATSPSGQSYLAGFIIEGNHVLKSAGFRKMKKCSSGSYVTFNSAGLVKSCK